VRFAFQHFPLTRIHPHALAAASAAVLERIQRDVDSGLASGQVLGTPTLFIDGVVHRSGYGPPALLAALATSE
jgi:hypothetical protein